MASRERRLILYVTLSLAITSYCALYASSATRIPGYASSALPSNAPVGVIYQFPGFSDSSDSQGIVGWAFCPIHTLDRILVRRQHWAEIPAAAATHYLDLKYGK